MDPKVDAKLKIGFEVAENNEENLLVEQYAQVIVKYNGDIEAVAQQEGGIAQIISEKYAAIRIPLEDAEKLLNYSEVEYMEAPKNFVYTLQESIKAACVNQVQNFAPYNLKGEGVLLGIIDSGIQYAHPDFRNTDGTTRLISLWDQSIPGAPPEGYRQGTEYTREQINEALNATTLPEQRAIVPSQDTIGHGTHVAGIAGGNGRASRGKNVGMAPEAEFIIVKLDSPGDTALIRTVDIMLGLKYIIEKARALERPVVVNISLGMNEGSHDGRSLIELFIEDMGQVWKTLIVIGAGNEGNANAHLEGKISQGETQRFELNMGLNKKRYNFSVWHPALDRLKFRFIAPNGQRTPEIAFNQPARRFVLGETIIYTSFAGPSPLNGAVEFATFMYAVPERFIDDGAWTIEVIGESVIEGIYNVWGQTKEEGGRETFFLESTPERTITTPSTASNSITVGAYNAVTNQIADFSGRGFTRYPVQIKPDLVAPGVDITAPSQTGGYRTLSGTSMAAPHVTGGAALLMEWGIVKGNQPFLYGETLKSYLLRGANRDLISITYPDPSWGYGTLCVKKSLDLLRSERVID